MSARDLLVSVVLLAAPAAFAGQPVQESRFRTIYMFTTANGDGGIPEDTPTGAGGDTLYGTTVLGGNANDGVVYALDTRTGTETTLYAFQGGRDGAQPQAGVIAHAGFLYGTTNIGGTECRRQGCGTVYRVDINTGQESVLHRFAGHGDGRTPSGGKLVYWHGALYGTTEYGGSVDRGTVYRVDLKTGALRILYSFTGGKDGKRPQGALIESGGVLYGTTFEGGGHHCRAECGTLFSIDPSSGAETILHAFTDAKDAQYPFGSMTANAGILYGASLYGGSAHHGAIFAYDTSAKTETVLTSFTKAHDGAVPTGVTYDNGALYGGTLVGGDSEYGVEWRIDPATGREEELHEFTGGEDGGLSYGAPAVRGGYLYGTTYQGGNIADCPDMGCGTIFRIKAK